MCYVEAGARGLAPRRRYGDTINDEKEVNNSQVFIWSAFYAREEKMKRYACFVLVRFVFFLISSCFSFGVQCFFVFYYNPNPRCGGRPPPDSWLASLIPALGDTVTCIQYHTWWPSSSDPYYQANIAENTARTNYYQPGNKWVPWGNIDGIVVGGTGYTQWGNFIRGRYIVDAPVDIRLQGYYSDPNGMVRVLVEATDFLSFSSLRVFVVITEDDIFWPGPNGTQIHEQTMRDMIPSSSGDPISLSSPGDTLLREYNFTIDGSWEVSNCNAVVFIQDYATKEIVQSALSGVLDLTMPGVEEIEARRTASLFALSPGYPNPFSDRARIEYTIPLNGRVQLHIYDSSGSLVRTLVRGWESAGKHTEYWDGNDDHGREVASGIYFSRLSYEGNTRAIKLSLVR